VDFNKLTLKSQEAVAGAQELARRGGNPEVYPEHLLVALLDQELPRTLVGDGQELRAKAEADLRARPTVSGTAVQPQAPRRLPPCSTAHSTSRASSATTSSRSSICCLRSTSFRAPSCCSGSSRCAAHRG